MSREEALQHIMQADARRQAEQEPGSIESVSPRSPRSPRSPPILTGYTKLTAEGIRAKLREQQLGATSPASHDGLRVQYKDGPSTGTDLEPYMFSRTPQNQISPDDTAKRIEMLRRRRRCLSSGNVLEDAQKAEEQEETVPDVNEMYAKSEEKVLLQLKQIQERHRQREDEISARLSLKSLQASQSMDTSTAQDDTSRDSDHHSDKEEARKEEKKRTPEDDISNEYLRTKSIEQTAEKLDYFRSKRQTADSMCNARLNRLLDGVGQRYATHQTEVVNKYISPSSHMVAAVLSGGRTSRPTSRDTTYGRRAMSSDRIRRHHQGDPNADGPNFQYYASNPFDV